MLLPFVILLVVPLASAGQQGSILAREDLRFARKLLEAGYEDLASQVCAAIVTTVEAGASAYGESDMFEAQVLALDCEVSQARRLLDLNARAQRMSASLAKAEGMRAHSKSGPWMDRLDEVVARTHQVYGETLITLLESSSNPAELASLRTKAEKSFTDAEAGLVRHIKTTRSLVGDANLDAGSLENSLFLDSYTLGKMQFLHARLVKDDEFKHVALLNEALDTFMEFGLDWGDTLLAYEGNIFQGLCLKELDRPDDAIAAFDDAIALRTTYEPLPDGRFDMPPEASDIVSAAVLQKLLFLQSIKDFAGASAAADDYMATTAEPLAATSGMAILAAQADALMALGNAEKAFQVAQTLLQADPQGPWGVKAREVLASDSGGGQLTAQTAQVRMRVIETLIGRGETGRAHSECRRLRQLAHGLKEEADIGAEALLLEGVAYARDGLLPEACVAFESAQALHPAGAKAPDALWRAISLYFQFYSEERRPLFKRLWNEKRETFLRSYPKHENAVLVQLTAGQELEAERDFAGAARSYQTVSKDSPAYGEARFRAGTCLYRQALELDKARKASEAAEARKQALPLLNEAQAILEKRREASLDLEVRGRLGGLAFDARATAAAILLLDGAARSVEVLPLLEDVETVYAGDDVKIATALGLRIRALELQGRLDDAVQMIDGLAQTSPDARMLGNAAGSLARTLDAAGLAAIEKDPQSKQGQQFWRNATRLYALSVRDQLTGQAALDLKELDDVGTRLLTLALALDGAPEEIDSFLDWQLPESSVPGTWDQVGKVLQAVADNGTSYRAEILLGRAHGFQGHWKEAAVTYLKLFEREPLLDVSGLRFDSAQLRSKPELLQGWIEWAMAEVELGKSLDDPSHLTRATEMLDKALGNLEAGGRLWWLTKCMQIETLVNRGQYEAADVALRSIERNNQDFDEDKHGARKRLLAAKDQIQKRMRPR